MRSFFHSARRSGGGCLHGEVRGMIPSEVCQEIMSAVMGLSMCASNTHSALPEQGKVDRREGNDSDIMAICLTKLPLGLHKASAVLWNHCVCIHNDLTTILFTITQLKLDIVKIRVDKLLHMILQGEAPVQSVNFFKQLKTELRFF